MFYKKKAFLLHFFAKKFCYIKKKQGANPAFFLVQQSA